MIKIELGDITFLAKNPKTGVVEFENSPFYLAVQTKLISVPGRKYVEFCKCLMKDAVQLQHGKCGFGA